MATLVFNESMMHWTVGFPTSKSVYEKTKPNKILQFKIKDDVAESFESHLNYTCIKEQSMT